MNRHGILFEDNLFRVYRINSSCGFNICDEVANIETIKPDVDRFRIWLKKGVPDEINEAHRTLSLSYDRLENRYHEKFFP